MIVTFENQGKKFSANLANPIDLSIPMKEGSNTVNAWYVDDLKIEPVRNEHFLGSVAEGGNVNFRNIFFNPHGHGTHTECVGHIDQQVHSINDVFDRHFFTAELVTIQPEIWASDDEWRSAGDHVILERQLDAVLKKEPEALIIRTIPNPVSKVRFRYSNTNPPYMCDWAAKAIREAGIQHLLIDLPSVDREKDGGKMLAHKAFWHYPDAPELKSTITELIYVPDHVKDGKYLLEMQVAAFVNDAAPSRPVIYEIE